ncbi:MAG: spi [Acidimicrobiales bacterium]|nr:spi [Acidimicrobiales bacterium]
MVLAAGACTLVACGGGAEGEARVTAIEVSQRAAATADPALAGQATTAFGANLFEAVAADADEGANVIVSPASVAMALALLEPGAVGDARDQLRRVLRITVPDAFHASMNALQQSLEGRVATSGNEGEHPGEVLVRVAHAAYLQQGYPFRPAYLDAIGRNYGPVLEEVDFESDPDAVAHRINRFVADATHDRITDIVGDGVLTPDTVFALVNALYLKASWLEVFDKSATKDGTFTGLDGTRRQVPMMHGGSDSSARGDGWVAATKAYVGGLSAQFILPDEGRFEEVANGVGDVISAYERARISGSVLVVPRFDLGFAAELTPALRALGVTSPYVEGHLLGIADDQRLVLDKALHQASVAMDEEGTEAAAATVLTGRATSAPPRPPVPVVLDRPFLFRILDDRTGATLFLGRVLDPSGH